MEVEKKQTYLKILQDLALHAIISGLNFFRKYFYT